MIPKFRAWDIQKKTMRDVNEIIGFYVNDPDYPIVVCLGDVELLNGQYELMQSTGLKGKNGKEIFEGDIVHFKTNGMSGLGFVYWNEELGQWWIKDIREVTKKRGQRYYPFWKDCEYRIYGNIYENPELLGSDDS